MVQAIAADAAIRPLPDLGSVVLHQRVNSDQALRTDAVAAFLLDHCDVWHESLTPAAALPLVESALTALTGSSDLVLICKAWRRKAIILMTAGDFVGAERAIVTFEDVSQGITDAIGEAAAFYPAQAAALRGTLCYKQHRTEESARLMIVAMEGYLSVGDHVRAKGARDFLARIEYRNQTAAASSAHVLAESFALTLPKLQADERMAIAEQDEQELAGIRGSIASVQLWLRHPAEAEVALTSALQLALDYGMDALHFQLQRVEALLILQRDGIADGIEAMEVVRARCHDNRMPGEAVQCLISLIEMIAFLDPAAETTDLCRQLQAEASSLSIESLLAEATERLTIASEAHRIPPYRD